MAIYTKRMSHQNTIVDFMANKSYTGVFADYGSGKTLCALSYIEYMAFTRILVISTKTSIESTWVDEIVTHSNFKYTLLLGNKDKKLRALQYGFRISQIKSGYYHSGHKSPIIFLLNFDGVKNIINELIACRFELIIVDESTKCKSPRTQRTKLLWALGKMIPNRVIMTGFPVTENLADIYAQIKFLDYGKTLGNSYYSFLDTYFVKYGSAYLPKRKMIPILLGKIKPFCIRVTNKMLNLPPKLYKKIKIEPTEQQLKILEQLNSLFMVEFGKVKFDTQYIFALVAKSLQICDGFIQDQHGNREAVETNKDQVLLDLMDDINVRKNKLLIWCSYRYSVAKLEAMLGKLRIPTLTLTGVTKNVNAVVHEFQRSKTTNVLIAIQKKASASITLTSCRYAIYYSNMWSFDERGNSEARIYRKGSEIHPNVVYTDLITAGSVEEKVYECLRKKKSLVDLLKKEFHDMGGTIK